ncbi:MAG TPA: alpha-L-rhamnosidase C-terminal domain-containing protein [Dysgonamonadaceae bacterium]|nr:alpha-L-rhamnosidase C-terminal domain-containing protein [Dysgonamonadaceae bacterium]
MLLKRIVLFSLFLLSINTFCFGQATWIGYPGDYDIWLGNNVNNRRTERGAFFPPFWKMDSHYVLVEFSKEFDLKSPEEIHIYVEGRYNVKLDGKLQNGTPSRMMLPEGKHVLNIKVHNQACVPAIYVEGKTVFTDSSWKVTFEDKEWIDESGKASDKSATVYMNAAALNFNSPEQRPSLFRLDQVPMSPLSITKTGKGTLVDFGKETFGYVTFHQLCGKGEVCIYYGESRDEALSVDSCETLDKIQVNNDNPEDLTLTDSKAYRYVYIENDDGVRFESISMRYEYTPLDYRGSFQCSDEEINRIWDVAAYTLHLTTREVFLDGIKRDRWAWSGDAIQSYLMNYYLFFDPNTVTRTINLLRGKDPVTSHINTIMDYTFYWFMSIYDYYLYTGDLHFIRQIYPKMVSLMDFVLGRTNAEGMVEGLSGDWVFVDWADGFMDKRGELSFEQLLFCKSLQTMALCASIAGNQTDKEKYTTLGDRLFSKLETYFWDDRKQAFVHNRKEGIKSEQVTRYANIFAILFDYVDNEKKQGIKKNVLLNDSIMKITTPYMRFYELASLCALGEQPYVTKEIKAYWGGMLKLGATSFWEKYNPEEKGSEHYAMYGRPFGKSLCHAWGASPLYLLGKYYLGVSPVKPGYEEFSVEPSLGGLEWIKGSVPTPYGNIQVFMDKKTIKVASPGGKGYLVFSSKSRPQSSQGKIEALGNNRYRLFLKGNWNEIVIKFKG